MGSAGCRGASETRRYFLTITEVMAIFRVGRTTTYALAEQGWAVAAVDFSDVAILRARCYGPGHVRPAWGQRTSTLNLPCRRGPSGTYGPAKIAMYLKHHHGIEIGTGRRHVMTLSGEHVEAR